MGGLREADKIDGFFFFTGDSVARMVVNEEACHITLHVNEESLFTVISAQLRVDGEVIETTHVRDDSHWVPRKNAYSVEISNFYFKLVINYNEPAELNHLCTV